MKKFWLKEDAILWRSGSSEHGTEPSDTWNFLTCYPNNSFQRRALLHGVSGGAQRIVRTRGSKRHSHASIFIQSYKIKHNSSVSRCLVASTVTLDYVEVKKLVFMCVSTTQWRCIVGTEALCHLIVTWEQDGDERAASCFGHLYHRPWYTPYRRLDKPQAVLNVTAQTNMPSPLPETEALIQAYRHSRDLRKR
jgi:hypothetical protein